MHKAGFAQLCITVLPHIQPFPPNAQFLRYRTHAFASQHPAHRANFNSVPYSG
jgi:hypothetical protein